MVEYERLFGAVAIGLTLLVMGCAESEEPTPDAPAAPATTIEIAPIWRCSNIANPRLTQDWCAPADGHLLPDPAEWTCGQLASPEEASLCRYTCPSDALNCVAFNGCYCP